MKYVEKVSLDARLVDRAMKDLLGKSEERDQKASL
jgi:hypothetical protein